MLDLGKIKVDNPVFGETPPTLPRTGSDPMTLMFASGGALGLGLLLLVGGRRRSWLR